MKTKKRTAPKLEVSESASVETVSIKNHTPFLYKLVLVVIFGVLSYLLASKYRGLFIAGFVNNQVITRFELNKALAERYGAQVFEEMANDRLLAAEIKKQNITVTQDEVKAELDKITKEYGSEENLNAALAQYGLTLEKAKQSIEKNLAFKKLVEMNGKIEITDEAVTKYFNDNKTMYQGKKIEEVKDSIKEMLYQQELYQKSQEIFGNIRQSAKVNSYL